jgi:hypothetical protein
MPRNCFVTPQYTILISVIIVAIVLIIMNNYVCDLWVYNSRLSRTVILLMYMYISPSLKQLNHSKILAKSTLESPNCTCTIGKFR